MSFLRLTYLKPLRKDDGWPKARACLLKRYEVHRMFKRKLSLAVGLMICAVAQAAEPLTIDVHRDANCGCCKEWVKHRMRTAKSSTQPCKAKTWCALTFKWAPVLAF